MINFTVEGEPVGKARPRFTKGGHVYTPKKTKEYEAKVRAAYIDAARMIDRTQKAIKVSIYAYYRIPDSQTQKNKIAMTNGDLRPTEKPDVDNLCKIILDALNGYAYSDDKQVVELHIEKWYSVNPRVKVVIQEA